MQASSPKPVRRRRVFYIPGFDPMPPRRYRELYRREAQAQAAISGYEITLTGQGGDTWEVTARIEGVRTSSRIEVLAWSDIVQKGMRAGIVATYLQLVRTAWIYLRSGALGRLMQLRIGPVIAALYPVVFLLAQLGLALVVAWGAGTVLAQGSGVPGLKWAGLMAVWPVLAFFRRYDRYVYAYYLMHDYAFSARARGANPPELEARIQDFVARIATAMAEDVDEVLVVGHSSGVHLGVSVLADLIRAGPMRKDGPALAFLSLGQVVPMLSFLPGAGRLRADLAYLGACPDLSWLDVSAPGDGCAFALCDPVAVSGVAPPDKRWPLVISAAFSQTLSPRRWRALRRRYFKMHFQYLCAFDRPGDYDYFRITAGPQTLARRFAGRAPSASRIERPLSPHRDMLS